MTADLPPPAPDLDAIEVRANAATPGPWRPKLIHARGTTEDANGTRPACYWVDHDGWIDLDDEGMYATRADAEFIAHARADVPALVAEVRRLQQRLYDPDLPPDKDSGLTTPATQAFFGEVLRDA